MRRAQLEVVARALRHGLDVAQHELQLLSGARRKGQRQGWVKVGVGVAAGLGLGLGRALLAEARVRVRS